MKHKKPTSKRGRGSSGDKPATIEALAELHASPNWQRMVERTRAEEERSIQQQRRGTRATVEGVLEPVLSGKPFGGPG